MSTPGSADLFFGWDVGGWNCDRNRASRDALFVVDGAGDPAGVPWRGNLKEPINAAESTGGFVDVLLALCRITNASPRPNITLGIDAPLGFPDALICLLTRGVLVGHLGKSAKNPYLYRLTERRLAIEGKTPLSVVKDMIGSQSTKAIHAVAKFAPSLVSPGVWSDGVGLTVIETL